MSLSAPGRVTLPRAPPHSLLLYNNQFSPFPAGWGLETPLVAKYTGDRLQLREGGQQMRQHFREQVGDAGLMQLSDHAWCSCQTTLAHTITAASFGLHTGVQCCHQRPAQTP